MKEAIERKNNKKKKKNNKKNKKVKEGKNESGREREKEQIDR